MSFRIGVFDSGIGGLSVLKELTMSLPAEYVYIGDTLRAPYGNLNREELLSHTYELLSFLKNNNVNFFVSACNSLSTLDVRPILESLAIDPLHYIDMIAFAKKSKNNIPHDARVLIYATQATVVSGMYQNIFKDFSFFTLISPNLARAIEEGNDNDVEKELNALHEFVIFNTISHVFLGCTHYPLIQGYIDKKFKEDKTVFVNPAVCIPDGIKEIPSGTPNIRLCFTRKTDRASALAGDLFNKDAEEVSLF